MEIALEKVLKHYEKAGRIYYIKEIAAELLSYYCEKLLIKILLHSIFSLYIFIRLKLCLCQH